MPRPKKPPADPIEMPRTEGDLDVLMKAVEAHMGDSHRIGTLYRDEKLTPEEVIEMAAKSDEQLYNLLDQLQSDREAEMAEHGRSAAQQT